MKFEIKNRYTYSVLFAVEAGSLKLAVEIAVNQKVDLCGADLSGSNLCGADLSGANLCGADLSGADLYGAALSGADLRGVDLRGADLRGADLYGAALSGADLTPIKSDLWMVLAYARHEVAGLLSKLRYGKINGSVYEGECCCLVGTLANIKGVNYNCIAGLKPDVNRPAEKWFLNIQQGDTPENSQVAKITEEWIVEWMQLMGMTQGVSDDNGGCR